jgi:hypothetical protein
MDDPQTRQGPRAVVFCVCRAASWSVEASLWPTCEQVAPSRFVRVSTRVAVALPPGPARSINCDTGRLMVCATKVYGKAGRPVCVAAGLWMGPGGKCRVGVRAGLWMGPWGKGRDQSRGFRGVCPRSWSVAAGRRARVCNRCFPMLGASSCRRTCSDSCERARDGRCSDGWLGDDSVEGEASCALGADCTDCGTRELCPVAGAPQLRLPREVLQPSAATTSLRASQVLFVVIGSSRFRGRAQRAHGSWCRFVRNTRCLFVADDEPPTDAASVATDPMPWLSIGRTSPPRHCCALKPGARHTKGFFCTSHRAKTLGAQYRFLPALLHVQRSAAVRSGAFRWVVLVDDDAFVFTPRLLWILARLDASKPIYAGDFGSSGEAVALDIPHFGCGGGGSVLSLAALQRMDVASCLARYHASCMQSDWMIGGCARVHNVSELRELGCGTCDPRRLREPRQRAAVRQRLRDERCFFLQNAEPFAKELPLGRHAGAIVHGLDSAATWAFFRKHNATAARGSTGTSAAHESPRARSATYLRKSRAR